MSQRGREVAGRRTGESEGEVGEVYSLRKTRPTIAGFEATGKEPQAKGYRWPLEAESDDGQQSGRRQGPPSCNHVDLMSANSLNESGGGVSPRASSRERSPAAP